MDDKPLFQLGLAKAAGLALGAAVAFTLAYSVSWGGFFMIGFLGCLFALAKFGTSRQVFYLGLTTGIVIYSIQLFWFYGLFGPAAVVMWSILGVILALFLLAAQLCFRTFNPVFAGILLPFLWTGFEYFRSELYYLRFSWANIGYAFSGWRVLPLQFLGVYGSGFLMAVYASMLLSVRRKTIATFFVIVSSALLALFPPSIPDASSSRPPLHVSGIQIESPLEHQVLRLLDRLEKKFPDTDLFVFSEYTFTTPVPESIKAWCRAHRRYFLAGGEELATNGNYFNTAFVVGTNGEIIFKQVKSVPVQFFKDGLPAREQNVWESPWGKIGICICYDLSYRRVTDQLVRLGAEALIVPTGDISEWGRQEHEMHSRVAPVRAAEYGIPIFRLCGSGISQWVNSAGHVEASAPFPGELATISGTLELHTSGRLPWDHLLAPFSVAVTLVSCSLAGVKSMKKSHGAPPGSADRKGTETIPA